jgi:tRNA(Leu) C34 or U34 (ribose-2'-O)-methylase TrmL
MKVDFEIVKVFYNNRYLPFTTKPTKDTTEIHYAIKIKNDYFLIGKENEGIHICND